MQDEITRSIEKLGDLIKDIQITMFTTSGKRGIRSRPMFTQEIPFDGDLWFLTSDDSEVAREIRDNEAVLLTYAHPGQQEYIAVNGVAELLNDRALIEALWRPAYKVWFPEGENDPAIRLIRVAVTRAEYWDEPAAPMRFLHFVKAYATGQVMEGGDHGTLRLRRQEEKEG